MKDHAFYEKEWRETVRRAIGMAQWLERNVGMPGWFEKKEEFELLVRYADVVKQLLRGSDTNRLSSRG